MPNFGATPPPSLLRWMRCRASKAGHAKAEARLELTDVGQEAGVVQADRLLGVGRQAHSDARDVPLDGHPYSREAARRGAWTHVGTPKI